MLIPMLGEDADPLGPDELRRAILRSAEELTKRVRQLVDDERASAEAAIELDQTIMAVRPATAIALAGTASSIAKLASEVAEQLMIQAQREYGAEVALRLTLDAMSAEQHEALSQESAERGIRYEPPYTAIQHLNQWHDDAMLSMRHIVDFTTLSESTIERMIERGDFPSETKIGERRVAWRWGDVRQIMFKLADEARKRDRRVRRFRST